MSVQLLHLSLSAVRPACQRVVRRLGELMYGIYFWTVLALLGSVTVLIALLPLRPQVIWSITHHAARLFLRLAGIAFVAQGREHLQGAARRIIVANHSSYLDGLFLMAALSKPCRFVAKRELQRLPVVGTLLRRIDAVFVERFDVRTSVADAHRLGQLVSEGASCIFFPEGTFTRAPGLMAFHLGAFSAAVESGLPVLPVALHGTRALLRDEKWLPHHAPVVMHIAEPIEPSHARDTFLATVELRDAARRAIREHCGEPDLLGTAVEPTDPA
jgi:1-acyl-sn-glycerol-3-phosphate acyltransferase